MAHSSEGRTPRAGADASYFECELCGATRRTRAIPYTRLGYPICPVCEFTHGP